MPGLLPAFMSMMLGAPGWLAWMGIALAPLALGCASTPVEGVAPASSALAPTATATATATPAAASAPATSAAAAPPGPRTADLLAGRPYRLHVPREPGAGRLPLVIYLHGFGSSAARLEKALDVVRVARERGVLLAVPDGSRDESGRRFWNAGAACCDFGGRGVDDVAYLGAVIDDVAARQPLDAERVFVVGYSNGGFMAHRLACALSARLAAVVSFSGAGPAAGAGDCTPSRPVRVLQIHGDADRAVLFQGGRVLGLSEPAAHPGAVDTVAAWGARNGCSREAATEADVVVSGRPASRLRFGDCRDGATVELWTVRGGGHLIGMQRADVEATFSFLLGPPPSSSPTVLP